MSTQEQEEHGEQAAAEIIPEPEIQERHRRLAHEMSESYRDDRPNTVLPGSDGMVAGTAVADWVDENGDTVFDKPGDHAEPGQAIRSDLDSDRQDGGHETR
ncbi:hypothetical protein [Nocardia jejuensis]|uniref:hypothetical protein n=1 Tax=Nocardia jejuensis TaxID=328049 RepID=UPI00083450C0|nr:hypothetical protein [Nocardia jejuensis]